MGGPQFPTQFDAAFTRLFLLLDDTEPLLCSAGGPGERIQTGYDADDNSEGENTADDAEAPRETALAAAELCYFEADDCDVAPATWSVDATGGTHRRRSLLTKTPAYFDNDDDSVDDDEGGSDGRGSSDGNGSTLAVSSSSRVMRGQRDELAVVGTARSTQPRRHRDAAASATAAANDDDDDDEYSRPEPLQAGQQRHNRFVKSPRERRPCESPLITVCKKVSK